MNRNKWHARDIKIKFNEKGREIPELSSAECESDGFGAMRISSGFSFEHVFSFFVNKEIFGRVIDNLY